MLSAPALCKTQYARNIPTGHIASADIDGTLIELEDLEGTRCVRTNRGQGWARTSSLRFASSYQKATSTALLNGWNCRRVSPSIAEGYSEEV